MGCCGKQRAQAVSAVRAARPDARQPSGASPGALASPPLAPRAAPTYGAGPARVYFRYVGATALTVFGSVSSTRYRFTAPGATLLVDPRDAAALAAVPHLKQVDRP